MKWEADAAILKEQGREEGREEGAARQKAEDEKKYNEKNKEEKQGFIKSLIAGGIPADKLYSTFGTEAVDSVTGSSN